MVGLDNVGDLVQMLGIIIALFHFLAGFVLYRDMVRISRVIRTRKSILFMFLSNVYILTLLAIIILFIII